MEMRPHFREILIRVFVHATEDENRMAGILRTLLPPGHELEKTELEGHHGNPIFLLEARVRGKKEVEETLSSLLRKWEGEAPFLSYLESQWNERGNLYLRLDKQEACRGRWVPGRGDEVIHLTLKTRTSHGERGNPGPIGGRRG